MNTYRVYVLDVTQALEPKVHIVYIQAEKYGPAWEASRGVLGNTDKGKGKTLFNEAECKTKFTLKGEDFKVSKIVDIRPRNVKVDKTALKALLADPKASDADKLAAMAKLLGA